MKSFKEFRLDEGTSARQRGEVPSPRSQKEYDALSPKDKRLVDARTKRAFKQSISRQPGESPVRRNRRTKNEEVNEVLMVRTQKTSKGDFEWIIQKVEHGKTETLPQKGTESSRAKAMAAGKKARKNLLKEEEIEETATIISSVLYLPSKDGKQTFVVSKRNTKGMRGKQDKFSMSVIDTKTKKEIEDLGSHESLKGAIKFALKRGFVKEAFSPAGKKARKNHLKEAWGSTNPKVPFKGEYEVEFVPNSVTGRSAFYVDHDEGNKKGKIYVKTDYKGSGDANVDERKFIATLKKHLASAKEAGERVNVEVM